MEFLAAAAPPEDSLIKTVDYVSGQGPVWLLTAALLILGSVVVFLMRKILKEAMDGRNELKALNEKHIAVLEKSAVAMADHAAEARTMGKQVISALENSSAVIKHNTEAINDNTDATKVAVKVSDATVMAILDLRTAADRNAADIRRQVEESESAIRRNTEAIEERKQTIQPLRRPKGSP